MRKGKEKRLKKECKTCEIKEQMKKMILCVNWTEKGKKMKGKTKVQKKQTIL